MSPPDAARLTADQWAELDRMKRESPDQVAARWATALRDRQLACWHERVVWTSGEPGKCDRCGAVEVGYVWQIDDGALQVQPTTAQIPREQRQVTSPRSAAARARHYATLLRRLISAHDDATDLIEQARRVLGEEKP